MSCTLGKVGKPRVALKDKQLMAIQHIYSCLASTLERQKQHIAIMDWQAMVLHGVAAHYYLRVQLTTSISRSSEH